MLIRAHRCLRRQSPFAPISPVTPVLAGMKCLKWIEPPSSVVVFVNGRYRRNLIVGARAIRGAAAISHEGRRIARENDAKVLPDVPHAFAAINWPQKGQRDDEPMAESCLGRDPVMGR